MFSKSILDVAKGTSTLRGSLRVASNRKLLSTLPTRPCSSYIPTLSTLSSRFRSSRTNTLPSPPRLSSTPRLIFTHRTLTTRTYPPEPTSFSDPTRPDLFYHLLPPPNPVSPALPVFALTFLAEYHPVADSSTIVGWLPAAAQAGEQEAGLNDFVENPRFRDVLQEAIRDGLKEGVDEIQINGAKQTQEGWMHIHDARNVPALGRIGDPDDILGSVRVEDGIILPETYQPMPSYRLCTADGVTQLTEGLANKLKAVLEERVATERARL
ncbi:hypothetical protein JAAARDRAFT_158152 [Jaapia argillacea MUCL 33604]|uniref:Uncharacterized protein n=1 Tax=Jaapia argillacea MUCL 33604 TaxID=933084 RepID=A0A067Q075_9AGAM|nr:hypothetical protein JAAARDRAFT_158152 [Jaapia argillacea MUCL 33604]